MNANKQLLDMPHLPIKKRNEDGDDGSKTKPARGPKNAGSRGVAKGKAKGGKKSKKYSNNQDLSSDEENISIDGKLKHASCDLK